jgi:hypothetical protein
MTDQELWKDELMIIGNRIGIWNQNVIPWMHERGDEYKRFAHAEAKRRGWKYDKDIHGYVVAHKISEEERNRVLEELDRREFKKYLEGKSAFRGKNGKTSTRSGFGKLQKTWIPKVLAFWEIVSADDTGILVLWDMRGKEFQYKVWGNVPQRLYRDLSSKNAKETLKNIEIMFQGQELGPREAVRMIEQIESNLMAS